MKTVRTALGESWREQVGGVIMHTAQRIPRAPHLKLTPACNDFACKFRASYESLVVLSSLCYAFVSQRVTFLSQIAVPWKQSRK
jgi:hypothetical protein